MATGKKMFKGKNTLEIFDKIIKHDVYYPANINKDCKDLIQKLVVSTPALRLGYKNYNYLKQHKFFEGVDWNELSLN